MKGQDTDWRQAKLDIDIDRTRCFYETVDDSLGFDCAGCRNFRIAYPLIPDAVQGFFRQLGVDIGKPAEMTAYVSHDGNLTLYDGFYHICGSILKSPKLFIQIDEKHSQLDENATIKLTPDHFAYFTSECALVEKEFPTPVIQMGIHGNIPWVLEESNPYHYPDD